MSPSSYDQENMPSGEYTDDSYVSRSGQKGEALGVISDREPVEAVDTNQEDTDAQLERDDREAIDESNILNERTRHSKPQGTYKEPGDTEGLPEDTGRSSANVVRPEK